MSITSPTGETSLTTLLSTLKTIVDDQTYVFSTLPPSTTLPPHLIPHIQMLFREKEGTTLILPLDIAQNAGLEYTFPSRMITLSVHSSLEAVGFMAVIANKLKDEGVPCNVVAAFYHDHVFVPEGRCEDVLGILEGIRVEAGGVKDGGQER